MVAAAGSWDFAEGDAIVPGLLALGQLGLGNTCETWLAFDQRLAAIVVAKLVRTDMVDNARVRAELRNEGELLARLPHPFIPRIFDGDLDGDRPYITMEQIEGQTLRQLVRRQKQLSPEQVLPVVLNICSALQYVASKGFVHLDVKSANIVTGPLPRLIDFSLARSQDAARGLRHRVGTRAYMPPEQCLPGEAGEIGPPADVWGVGVSVYEALAGSRPFPGGVTTEAEPDAPVARRYPQVEHRPAPLPGWLPRDVRESVMATLHPDPAQRPTAVQLMLSLEPVVSRLPRPRSRLGR